jgi:hypothetical protein
VNRPEGPARGRAAAVLAAVRNLVWYHVPNSEPPPWPHRRHSRRPRGRAGRWGSGDGAARRQGGLPGAARKGRLSPAQLEFRAACLAAGALYAVARSTDEATEVLRSWGAVRIGGRGRAA